MVSQNRSHRLWCNRDAKKTNQIDNLTPILNPFSSLTQTAPSSPANCCFCSSLRSNPCLFPASSSLCLPCFLASVSFSVLCSVFHCFPARASVLNPLPPSVLVLICFHFQFWLCLCF
ncbi:hypothetical protein QL285_091356 [Trifolium repens]|nr:hypothetical protein QL285_091356 [Trifolium repens]